MKVKLNGVWYDSLPQIKVSGGWRKASAEYVKVGGTWRQIKQAVKEVLLWKGKIALSVDLQATKTGGIATLVGTKLPGMSTVRAFIISNATLTRFVSDKTWLGMAQHGQSFQYWWVNNGPYTTTAGANDVVLYQSVYGANIQGGDATIEIYGTMP